MGSYIGLPRLGSTKPMVQVLDVRKPLAPTLGRYPSWATFSRIRCLVASDTLTRGSLTTRETALGSTLAAAATSRRVTLRVRRARRAVIGQFLAEQAPPAPGPAGRGYGPPGLAAAGATLLTAAPAAGAAAVATTVRPGPRWSRRHEPASTCLPFVTNSPCQAISRCWIFQTVDLTRIATTRAARVA